MIATDSCPLQANFQIKKSIKKLLYYNKSHYKEKLIQSKSEIHEFHREKDALKTVR